MRAYPPPKFRVSRFLGAEIARGHNMPTLRGRVVLRSSPVSSMIHVTLTTVRVIAPSLTKVALTA